MTAQTPETTKRNPEIEEKDCDCMFHVIHETSCASRRRSPATAEDGSPGQTPETKPAPRELPELPTMTLAHLKEIEGVARNGADLRDALELAGGAEDTDHLHAMLTAQIASVVSALASRSHRLVPEKELQRLEGIEKAAIRVIDRARRTETYEQYVITGRYVDSLRGWLNTSEEP